MIFTISALWDEDASVWTGHCDEVDPASVFLQNTALREAEPAAAA